MGVNGPDCVCCGCGHVDDMAVLWLMGVRGRGQIITMGVKVLIYVLWVGG